MKLERSIVLLIVNVIFGLTFAQAQTYEYQITNGFSSPTEVNTSDIGDIFVSDTSNHRIQIFNSMGIFIGQIGSGVSGNSQGTIGSTQFNLPTGTALDVSGNLFISDTGNHQIIKCVQNGNCSVFAGSGSAGLVDGVGNLAQFHFPRGLAIDKNDNLYIADTSNNVIRMCDSGASCVTLAGSLGTAGSLIDGFGSQAGFNAPSDLNMSAIGMLLVADRLNHAIRQIDPATSLVVTLLGSGISGNTQGDGQFAQFNQPRDVATDESGNIYVSDSNNHRIAMYNDDATFTHEFGSLGILNGEFDRPSGVVVDDVRIYVSEINNNRIQVFLRDTPAPVTNCIDDTSAAIAAARSYQQATRLVHRGCGKNETQDCLSLLQDQQNSFGALAELQVLIHQGCQ